MNTKITLLSGSFIVFLTILFGANAVAIKVTLAGMGPLTTAGLRFTLAAAAIACWARLTGRPFLVRPDQVVPLTIVSIGFTLQICLFYLGLERTEAARGVLISNLLPFLVLFLSHRFIPGERITGRKLIGAVLGFGGVAVMVADRQGASGSLTGGDPIILAAVVLWSCNVVYTKRIISDYHPFHLVLYPMLVSVPVFLTAGFLWEDPMIGDLNPMVVGAYVYQSLVSAAFGFVAWSTLLQRYGASTLHAFVFIMPIAGVVFSGLILDEPITPRLTAAMVLIAAGILIVHASPKRPAFTFLLGKDW